MEVIAGPAAAVAAALATGAAVIPTAISAGAIYVVLRETAVWAGTLRDRAVEAATESAARWRAVRLMIATYLLMVIVGGALLWLPSATVSDHRNSPYTHLLNSLFMAGSAATCTGLSVYDFAAEYTAFGKAVSLVLMQVGGLAIMVFGTLFGLMVAQRLWPRQVDGSGGWDARRLGRLVKSIVIVSLGLEAIGAVLLYPATAGEPSLVWRGFESVFLAVSAFCNVGLCPQPNSLVGMAGVWQVYGVILPLIVLGGIGFPVLYELGHRLKGFKRSDGSGLLPLARDRWSLHSRLVTRMMLSLIIIGSLGFLFFETPWARSGFWYVGRGNLLNTADAVQTSGQTMRGHDAGRRFQDAIFQSVAARTTAFKTVQVKTGAINPASLTLMMGLMLIGGAPGSTAGGFHVIPLAILLMVAAGTLSRSKRKRGVGRDRR